MVNPGASLPQVIYEHSIEASYRGEVLTLVNSDIVVVGITYSNNGPCPQAYYGRPVGVYSRPESLGIQACCSHYSTQP